MRKQARRKRPREPLPIGVKLGITSAILSFIALLCWIVILLRHVSH